MIVLITLTYSHIKRIDFTVWWSKKERKEIEKDKKKREKEKKERKK